MNIYDLLIKIGLNDKETKVYLAALNLGESTAYKIATKAGIKKPITYVVLEALQKKGLINISLQQRKKLYFAEDPNKILSEQFKKYELLKRFMPELQAMFVSKKQRPRIQLFEGEEGIKSVYREILETGKETFFFGTGEGVENFDKNWLIDFLQNIKIKNIPVKDIIMRSPANLNYAKQFKDSPYILKFMPQGFKVPADCAIFDNKIAIFNFESEIFCLLIHSPNLYQLFKTMHQLAWRSAEEITIN